MDTTAPSEGTYKASVNATRLADFQKKTKIIKPLSSFCLSFVAVVLSVSAVSLAYPGPFWDTARLTVTIMELVILTALIIYVLTVNKKLNESQRVLIKENPALVQLKAEHGTDYPEKKTEQVFEDSALVDGSVSVLGLNSTAIYTYAIDSASNQFTASVYPIVNRGEASNLKKLSDKRTSAGRKAWQKAAAEYVK